MTTPKTNTERIVDLAIAVKHSPQPYRFAIGSLLRLSEEFNLWGKDRQCSNCLDLAEKLLR